MRRILFAFLTLLAIASCGGPAVKRDTQGTRDRANQSFQDLEREESRQQQGGGSD